MDGERRADWSLSRPGRCADHVAEIPGSEGGILVGEHIGFDVAKGRLGSVVNAVVERLDDYFLEMGRARVRLDDGFALSVGELSKNDPQHVDAGGDGMHVLGNAGRRVQRDRGRHRLDVAPDDQ